MRNAASTCSRDAQRSAGLTPALRCASRLHGVLALVAAFALAGPARAEDPPKPITVPFTMLPSRHIMVEASINGKGPYRLIFDTGAPLNLVSSKLAKAAGLKAKGGGLFAGPATALADPLTIGDATAEKVPTMIMDHPTVKAISTAFEKDHGPIEGIVGFPFFARYAMTIDYQAKTLTLTPNGYKPGDYLQDMVGRLQAAADAGKAPKVVVPAGLWGFEMAKSDDGVVVSGVSAGGPAAGLKVGDRLVTIDGRWADTVADAYAAAAHVKPGRTVAVVVVRDGKELAVDVTPAKGL